MNEMTIGDVARLSGFAATTIRYYETIGLLPAPVRVNGRRRYSEQVFSFLALIRTAQKSGYTITKIKELLGNEETDHAIAIDWKRLGERRLTEIDAQISALKEQKRWVTQTMNCSCVTAVQCGELLYRSDPLLPG